jgi:GNAT superfamily N-acetyltransferase
VVRPGTAEDAEAVARIHIRGWQQAYAHVFPAEDLAGLSLERRTQTAREALASDVALVAERDGDVLGFAFAGPSRDEEGVAELYSIYVDPRAWGRGLGRELIVDVERRLRDNFDRAELWVLEDNPRARRFYEAAGWSTDGTTRPIEIFGIEVPEVLYRKRL